jgi:hypothetical protein
VRRQVKSLVRNQVGSLLRSLVKSLTPSLSPDQSVSIVSFVERMVTRKSFVRMAKEWANKDRYHPSHGVPEPRMPLPKGKGFVYTVPAWGDRRASGGGKTAGQGPPARPVRVTGQTGARQIAGEFGFHGHDARGFSPFSRGTDGRYLMSVVLSLLDVLHLVINTSLGEVAVLSLRGATDHRFSFVVLVLLQ